MITLIIEERMEYLKVYGSTIIAYFIANASNLTASEMADVIIKICVAIPTIVYTVYKTVAIIRTLNKKK